MASKHQPYWSTQMTHDLGREKNEFIVSDSVLSPFVPIMLYMRGLEKAGSEQTKNKIGQINYQYELSLLSDGVKCATQGRKCWL